MCTKTIPLCRMRRTKFNILFRQLIKEKEIVDEYWWNTSSVSSLFFIIIIFIFKTSSRLVGE